MGGNADAKLYVDVAALLRNQVPPSGAAAPIADAAIAGTGVSSIQFFGTTRAVDFSLFVPRGHYVDDPALESYFRAITWLGTIDLRILETQSDGTQLFRRAQLEGAYAPAER